MSQEQRKVALTYLEASRDAGLVGEAEDFTRFLDLALGKFKQMKGREDWEWKMKAMKTMRMIMTEAEECIKDPKRFIRPDPF